MSNVSDLAIVRLILADYANTDAGGKLNVIGGNVTVIHSTNGRVFGLALVVSVDVPSSLHGAEATVDVVLEDSTGQRVAIKGSDCFSDTMVISDPSREDPQIDGSKQLRFNWKRLRFNWLFNFHNDIRLTLDKRYIWRVTIDGITKDDWTEEFYVVKLND